MHAIAAATTATGWARDSEPRLPTRRWRVAVVPLVWPARRPLMSGPRGGEARLIRGHD